MIKSCSFPAYIKAALIILSAVVFLSGCTGRYTVALPTVADFDLHTGAVARKDLRVGVVPGPYGDMFMDAIYPSLSEMGYTAELVFFDNFTLPNFALAKNEIDLNMFQHYRYLVNFKFDNDVSLSAIAEVPTASMGIYSAKHESIDYLHNNITVSLPDDSTNLARALIVLENAGLIRLAPYVDKARATLNDIVSNAYNIEFVPLPAHALVQELPYSDFAVINGNFALSGGLKLSDAVFNEWLQPYYVNVIAVRTEDLGERFVSDILTVMRSEAYWEIITDPNSAYADFQLPLNFVLRNR
ncbi:MAG: MetQ/NlpA family ABC transporter substrate-binding protein [Defluviitaleaceae bacterium]|nr:MetQ/NlpA family ABC transporter substrate-binding protein [Defluviitaleaceae bacterium]